MIKSPAYLAALGSVATVLVLVLIAFSVAGRGTPSAGAVAGTVDAVAIDMDTTGNDDSTVGTIEDCASLAGVGDTLDFDLVVQGVDPADKIAGYQVDIDYDPSIIQINSFIDVDASGSVPPDNLSIISRISSSGGVNFLSLSDTSVAGSATLAAVDATSNPAPPNNHESGEGVLARITIEAVGIGESPLTIPGPAGGADGAPDVIITAGDGSLAGLPIPVADAADGAIAVGQACTGITTPDVQIMGLNCSGTPEVVAIKNFGTGEQDLTGWQVRSDPVGSESLALGGSIQPGQIIIVYSGNGAPAAPAAPDLSWGAAEKYRDADTSDFAEIVNGVSTTVDQENCVQGETIQNVVGGYSPSSTEDGIGTCADAVDNGEGDGADDADLSGDCSSYNAALTEGPLGTCEDTLDNNSDSRVDIDDPTCHTDLGNPTPENYNPRFAEGGSDGCIGGIDDDGDNFIDAADPDCREYDSSLSEDGVGSCEDGVNNDTAQDDVADADDPDCLATLSTDGPPLDSGVDGAGPGDPTEVTVATSVPGTIRIMETAFTNSPPAGSGLTFFGDEVNITADPGTADTPLILTFNIDETALFGAPGDTVKAFKDGVEVAACTAGGGTASPDPCVVSQVAPAPGADDLVITVLSSTGSVWDFGGLIPSPTPVPGITPAPSGPVATVLPPTGQPFADSGNSLLPWLLIGIGVAIALGATGYVAYSGSRRRNTD